MDEKTSPYLKNSVEKTPDSRGYAVSYIDEGVFYFD
jgi:hypothetical protein